MDPPAKTDIAVQPGQSIHISLLGPAAGNYDLTCAGHDGAGWPAE
jgi:uncharacterized cupredoxin-like copper-binding protein